jgi:hypothetical protein
MKVEYESGYDYPMTIHGIRFMDLRDTYVNMVEVWQTCISAPPKVDTSHLSMQRGDVERARKCSMT